MDGLRIPRSGTFPAIAGGLRTMPSPKRRKVQLWSFSDKELSLFFWLVTFGFSDL